MLRRKTATEKIMMLTIRRISPMVKLVRLLITIDSISVPSITPPPRMHNPIPAPRKKPPNTAIRSLSFVIIGKETRKSTMASPEIANDVVIANVFETCLYPAIMNGMLISTIRIGSGIFVVYAVRREMPVTPPSMNPLGSKNPFKPNAAEKMPIRIKALFLKYGKTLSVFLFTTR